MAFVPSPEQQAVFDYVLNETGNLAISARAGTGKTTTLVELVKRLPTSASKIFCAFNRDIIDDLQRRMAGTDVETLTFHTIGNRALKRHLGIQPKVENGKYSKLAADYIVASTTIQQRLDELAEPLDISARPKLRREMVLSLRNAMSDLVGFSRYKLIGAHDTERVATTFYQYGLDAEIMDSLLEQEVIAAYTTLLQQGEDAARTGNIDFTDMIYLPVKWSVRLPSYDYVLVDEAQDQNPAQRELISRLIKLDTGRIILVGDPRQAIYAFTGADSDSFDLSVARFNAHVLPLTVTRRCAQVIVHHSRHLVPDFQAVSDSPRGQIVWWDESRLTDAARPGDMVLCRLTAPLVAAMLTLAQARIPAAILGKNIGEGLCKIVDKVDAQGVPVDRVLDGIARWEQQQVDRAMRKDDKRAAEHARDQAAALRCVIDMIDDADGPLTYDRLKVEVLALFDDKGDARSRVTLSTIHKAKGTEAERVFILKPEKLPLAFPGLSAEQVQQEENLDYVARTRAKRTLVYLINTDYLKRAVPAPYMQKYTFDNLPWPNETLTVSNDVVTNDDSSSDAPVAVTVEPVATPEAVDVQPTVAAAEPTTEALAYLKAAPLLSDDAASDEVSHACETPVVTEPVIVSVTPMVVTPVPFSRPDGFGQPGESPYMRLRSLVGTLSLTDTEMLLRLLSEHRQTLENGQRQPAGR